MDDARPGGCSDLLNSQAGGLHCDRPALELRVLNRRFGRAQRPTRNRTLNDISRRADQRDDQNGDEGVVYPPHLLKLTIRS